MIDYFPTGCAVIKGLRSAQTGNSMLVLQTVFACERLVDKTIAHRFPKAPFVISFLLRLYNNVWGGMNFIDHARWTGIQPEEAEDK